MTDGATVLVAPAKLTVRLHVTGIRNDGYHLLDATMVALDLHDRLTVRPAARSEVRYVDAGAGSTVEAGPDDLVTRALVAAGRTAEVTVAKSIPAGAGLGGGSADAAAVLRWAGVDDLGTAARLGADVPFCLIGGRARVRGIGEDVERVTPDPGFVTLLTPPLHVSTPAVYRAWDDLGGPTEGDNHLEPAALVVAPELARWRDALGEATGVTPRLAGSGGTWWVHGAHGGVEVDGVGARLTRTA